MDHQYVLILGAPRSGTTLLAAMIGCHDEVAMLNEELGFAAKNVIGKRIVGNKLCIPNQVELGKKRARWIQFAGKRGFHALHRYGYFRFRPEAEVSIDDYMLWGNTRIIGILRDGNAVFSSIQKRGRQPLRVASYRWCRSIEILDELKNLYDGRFLLLSFERLVTDPESAMRAVAAHLDLTYQSRMLAGYRHTRNYPNESGIDPSRAVKHVNAGIDYRIDSHFPDIHEKYQRLLKACDRSLTVTEGV